MHVSEDFDVAKRNQKKPVVALSLGMTGLPSAEWIETTLNGTVLTDGKVMPNGVVVGDWIRYSAPVEAFKMGENVVRVSHKKDSAHKAVIRDVHINIDYR